MIPRRLHQTVLAETVPLGPFAWRAGTWLLLFFAAGLVARLAVTLFLADNHQALFEYMDIARSILAGHGYSFNEWGRAPLQPTSFLPPLYVWWCVFFMWLSPGNYLLMYIVQAVVAASGCLPAFLVGRRMFSSRTGLIFAAAYALYPEFVFLHSRPVTEFAYVVLALWLFYLYLRLVSEPLESRKAFRLAALTGLLCGVTILVKEGASVIIAAMTVMLLVRRRPIRSVIKLYLLPLVGVIAAVMSPWVIRNYIVQGRFIPIRTGYGLTMWIANHHGATGTDKFPDGSYVWAHLPSDYEEYMSRSLPPDEQDRDVFYRSEVRRFVARYPGEYLELCAKRLWYYVWFDPTHPLARNPVYRISYLLLLAAAIPGLFMAVRNRKLDLIIPLTYLGYLALYVPVLVLPRYRIIPVLILLLMASYAVDTVWSWRSSRTHRT